MLEQQSPAKKGQVPGRVPKDEALERTSTRKRVKLSSSPFLLLDEGVRFRFLRVFSWPFAHDLDPQQTAQP